MKSSASAPSRTTWTLLARLECLKACRVSSTSAGLSSTSKISTEPLFNRCPSSQCEVEGCSSVHRGLSPDPSSVAVDGARHDGQPHSGSLVFLSLVHSLEHAEELVRVFHVEPHAV